MNISGRWAVSGDANRQKKGKFGFLFGISLLPLICMGMTGYPTGAARAGDLITTEVSYDKAGEASTLSGTTIIPDPEKAIMPSAVTVSNGASLTLDDTGGPVTINATDQDGLLVTGAGSTVVSTGAIITSTAAELLAAADAVAASDGGSITLSGGSVSYTKTNANGSQSSAIYASGSGSVVTANNVDIEAINQAENTDPSEPIYFVFGVSTLNGGHVIVNGGSITADAQGELGNSRAYAVNAGEGEIDLNNVTVTSSGTYSHAVVASGGTVIIEGGSVTAVGKNADGLYSAGNSADNLISASDTVISATNAGVALDVGSQGANYSATIDVKNSQITAGQYGVSADGTGLESGGSRTINILDSDVVVTGGEGAFGAVANAGGTVNMTGGSLSAVSGGDGVHVSNGGVFTATGTNIAASGVGFLIDGSGANQVVMTGGSLTAGAEAFKIESSTGTTIDLNGVKIANGPVFLDASGGTVSLGMTDMNVKGDVVSNDGSVVDMNLVNSTIIGTLPDGSSANVGTGSDFLMENSAVFASLSNSGVVGFTPGGTPGNIMTVQQGYASQGGTIELNASLGGDSAPADKLVVNGNASGVSFVDVTNVGGAGGLTQQGVKLVDLDGSSSAKFMLDSRVASGAYEYTLTKGGPGGDDGDWYLRSNTYDPRRGWVPNYRPEVAVNSVIAPLALEYGYAMLGTLDERAGLVAPQAGALAPAYEDRVVRCPRSSKSKKCVIRVPVAPTQATQQQFFTGAWGRVMADRTLHDNDDFYAKGADYDYTLTGIQLGLDLWGRQQPSGTLDKAGLYVGYGQISADVNGARDEKAGTVDMDAYTLGAYWTHRADTNWYTDTVLQGTWYTSDARSVLGEEIKPDGFGILGSVEAGYTFKLGNGVTLEPQAQAVYQNVSFDDASDHYGRFAFNDNDSLRARVGLRLAKSWNVGDAQHARLISAWGKVNVWHEFLDDTSMSISGLNGLGATQFSSPMTGTWGEINAGVSGQIADAVSAFVSASYQHSVDNQDMESWDGRIGLSMHW